MKIGIVTLLMLAVAYAVTPPAPHAEWGVGSLQSEAEYR